MFQHSLILVSLLLMVSAAVFRLRRAPQPARRAPNARASAAARAVVKARLERTAVKATQPRAVQPAAFEWTAPPASNSAAVEPEDSRARIRDRYIAARFPGMPRGSAGLREIEHVVHVARLYFEEGKVDRAHELLLLAVEETPSDKSLRLAQLEICFLCADAGTFTPLALAFDAAFPGSPEWSEVSRLGRALAPTQPRFDAPQANLAHAHYGPWPDTPNWIQASWDLTSEVLAADFHRALANRQVRASAEPLRRVA